MGLLSMVFCWCQSAACWTRALIYASNPSLKTLLWWVVVSPWVCSRYSSSKSPSSSIYLCLPSLTSS